MGHPTLYPGAAPFAFPTRAAALAALVAYDATEQDDARTYSVEPYNAACHLTGFTVFVKRPGWRSGWLREA